MDPEEIKFLLRRRGKTLADVARNIGSHRQIISAAIQSRVSERAERAIAECLGMRPHKIWPSRYDRRDKRLSIIAQRALAAEKAA